MTNTLVLVLAVQPCPRRKNGGGSVTFNRVLRKTGRRQGAKPFAVPRCVFQPKTVPNEYLPSLPVELPIQGDPLLLRSSEGRHQRPGRHPLHALQHVSILGGGGSGSGGGGGRSSWSRFCCTISSTSAATSTSAVGNFCTIRGCAPVWSVVDCLRAVRAACVCVPAAAPVAATVLRALGVRGCG